MDSALAHVLPSSAQDIGGELHIGGLSVKELASTYGTPLVVYDGDEITLRASAWVRAAHEHQIDTTFAFATKSCSLIGIIGRIRASSFGADVASEGEYEAAVRAGIPPSELIVHGNNKSRRLLERCVEDGAGFIVVDAQSELDLLASVATAAGRTAEILVRINPDIEVETHRYISTSHAGSKFGVSPDAATDMIVAAHAHPHLHPRGVHVHLGSQLLDTSPWNDVVRWLADWWLTLERTHAVSLDTLDVGGGLGIAYTANTSAPSPKDVFDQVSRAFADHWTPAGLSIPHVIVEPGRSIVGPSACTVYEVGVVKDEDGAIRYVNVDGGMSDNPRPMLYQAQYTAALANKLHIAPTRTWWIAGSHCESGDVLAEDVLLPEPERGDLLVIPATGAYAVSMASTYNLMPRAAVCLVTNGQHALLSARETIDDMFFREPNSLGSNA